MSRILIKLNCVPFWNSIEVFNKVRVQASTSSFLVEEQAEVFAIFEVAAVRNNK
jgi:hypothetical protein